MSKLDKDPRIIALANDLGLPQSQRNVQGIVDYCVMIVSGLCTDQTNIQTLEAVRLHISNCLSLTFEEVWSETDLNNLVEKYKQMGDIKFAYLNNELDADTFAALYERDREFRSDQCRFVAIIDCRKTKAKRRYFSMWHEIAHLLTKREVDQFPFHRSNVAKDPLEQLMDVIAGEIGFYRPIFGPALNKLIDRDKSLNFKIVTEMNRFICPQASYESTAIACVNQTQLPIVYLEAGPGFKKADALRIKNKEFAFWDEFNPTKELRVLKAIQNDAARLKKFRIDQNMLVPKDSAIDMLYTRSSQCTDDTSIDCFESLEKWKHSNGQALGTCNIRIIGRTMIDRIEAFIHLIDDDHEFSGD